MSCVRTCYDASLPIFDYRRNDFAWHLSFSEYRILLARCIVRGKSTNTNRLVRSISRNNGLKVFQSVVNRRTQIGMPSYHKFALLCQEKSVARIATCMLRTTAEQTGIQFIFGMPAACRERNGVRWICVLAAASYVLLCFVFRLLALLCFCS